MSDSAWERTTFAGTERAQAAVVRGLTPDERVRLLEELLEVAAAGGALERARRDKQDRLDAVWRRGD